MQVETVAIQGPDGQKITINKSDHDPKKQKLWKEPAADGEQAKEPAAKKG